jgi:hypothetical protein
MEASLLLSAGYRPQLSRSQLLFKAPSMTAKGAAPYRLAAP